MTVKELITLLEQANPDAECRVVRMGHMGTHSPDQPLRVIVDPDPVSFPDSVWFIYDQILENKLVYK